MTDDDNYSGDGHVSVPAWLSEAIANFNLPTVIAGPAGAAISRLIGGAVDIPAAWLDQKAQSIKDRTKAKSELSKVITELAINEVRSDPDLPRRAAEILVAREFRSQINKEAVAAKTIEFAKLNSLTTDAFQRPGGKEDKPAEPAADWMNVFEQYAATATSDHLRERWAGILAGQIRHPETFSIKTLRVLSELRPDLAQEFEKAAAHVQQDLSIPMFDPPVAAYQIANQLEEVGLMRGQLGSTMTCRGDTVLFYGKTHAIVLVLEPGTELTLPVWPLTGAGREILQLTKRVDVTNAVQLFAQRVKGKPEMHRFRTGS